MEIKKKAKAVENEEKNSLLDLSLVKGLYTVPNVLLIKVFRIPQSYSNSWNDGTFLAQCITENSIRHPTSQTKFSLKGTGS